MPVQGTRLGIRISYHSHSRQLENEPEMLIPGFFAVDGNSSMKRSAAAGQADPRKYTSDYKIDDESINLYANEVKTRTRVTETESVR